MLALPRSSWADSPAFCWSVAGDLAFALIVQTLLCYENPCWRGKAKLSAAKKDLLRKITGLTSHPLFLEGHYKGYDHIVAVACEREGEPTCWLPITTESGQAGSYCFGALGLFGRIVQTILQSTTRFWHAAFSAMCCSGAGKTTSTPIRRRSNCK